MDSAPRRCTLVASRPPTGRSTFRGVPSFAAVSGFDVNLVDPNACVTSAQKFGVERFQQRLHAIVAETVENGGTPRKVDRPVGGLFAPKVQRRGAESMRIR